MKILIYMDSEKYHHSPVLMGKIIANATGGEINVLVVIPKGGHPENGDAAAEQVKLDLEGYSPKIFIKQGNPKKIIREELDREPYQLVIADTDRINRIRKSIEVDPVLIKQSAISLLLTQQTKPKINNILLCTGCKEDDYLLIIQASGLAADLGAAVTLLHVFPGAIPSMYTGLEQIEETVDEMLQTDTLFAQYLRRGVEILKENNIESEVKIRRGIPIEEIVRETQVENYDLVVIGSSMVDQGLIEMLLGNLAVKIINRIELPVLVIGTRSLT
ncbi:MAG: universal stress protein [Anaerolineales bacterium]|nr:universal stress protein [Anaerolineales bacterium]